MDGCRTYPPALEKPRCVAARFVFGVRIVRVRGVAKAAAPDCLSTVEAIGRVIGLLESTKAEQQLLVPFRHMVAQQLGFWDDEKMKIARAAEKIEATVALR